VVLAEGDNQITGLSNKREWYWQGVRHASMRREIHQMFCGANVKGPPGRTRYRWENNTEMELKEIRWKGVNRIQLAPDRDKSRDLVKRVPKFCVPSDRVY
jgi:hypothetical protein